MGPKRRLWNSLTLSNVKTKILLMRLKISSINLEKVVALFMIWINSAEDWSRKKKSYRLPWRRLRQPWRWRKTKFFVPSLNWLRSDKKLIDVLLRKKRSSTTPGKIMPVPWILLEHQLKQSSDLKERLSVLRNSLKEKLMNLRLD